MQRYRYPDPGDTNAGNILRAFDYNWFEARQILVYEYDSGHEREGLDLMAVLIEYRKKIVDRLLISVMKQAAKKMGSRGGEIYATEIGFRYQDLADLELGNGTIDANAPGSSNVTSDYDVTFSIPNAPELETDAVSLFNKQFESRWNLPSAVVFDTNVYTSGFMSAQARKTYEGDAGHGTGLRAGGLL